MELYLLRSLVYVAKHGSYTRAADELHLGQPTVYQHVRRLERLYGTRLVEPQGKRVRLTEHGRVVVDYGRRLLAIADEMGQALADDKSLRRGNLVLVAGTTAGEFLLPHISVGFQRLYPGIHISILINNNPAQIDAIVRDRGADLGFHSDPSPTPGVVKEEFAADEVVAILPPTHHLTVRNRICPDDLVGESVVLFEATGSPVFRTLTDLWLAQAGLQVGASLEANSIQSIKEAVRAGGGIALVPRTAVRDNDNTLVIRPLTNPPRRTFFLIARDGGWESHLVRTFRQYARSGLWAIGAPPQLTPIGGRPLQDPAEHAC